VCFNAGVADDLKPLDLSEYEIGENGKPVWKTPPQSRERMNEITRYRKLMAQTDKSFNGGRPRKNFSRAETEEATLTRLQPVALAVLEAQLADPDKRVAQTAAKLLLEWKRGKPVASVKNENSNVHTIRYEAAAWRPEMAMELVDGELA
jgi:hypothetical protein